MSSAECSVRIQRRLLSLLLQLPASYYLLVIVIFTGKGCVAVDLSQCNLALGMQSGLIPDSAIRASSSYDDVSVGPANGRVRLDRSGGAWCPKQAISRNVYEWIEVDLQELKAVTQVETQGRHANGQGQEFVEQYMLEYQRHEGGPWTRYRDRKGNEMLTGNVNTFVAETRVVSPPIIARKVRVVPYSSHPRTVCLRLELYGCTWREGIVSYSMPQGERRGSELDFLDFTYDGRVTDTQLSGGLGQLTDGIEGPSNFRVDQDGSRRKGYDWVGWKNDTAVDPPSTVGSSIPRGPVRIVFEFGQTRNLSAVWFHANNMFTKEVRVFRRAILYFGQSSEAFDETRPLIYNFMRDTLMESARNVIIPIPHRIASTVVADLFFDAKWMMISEVRFESDIVSGNISDDSYYGVNQVMSDTTEFSGSRLSAAETTTVLLYVMKQGNSSRVYPIAVSAASPSGQFSYDERLEGAVIGGMAVTVLLLIALIILCVIRRCVALPVSKTAAGRRLGNQLKGYDNVANSARSPSLPYRVAFTELQHRQLPDVPLRWPPLTTIQANADDGSDDVIENATYDVIADDSPLAVTLSCRPLASDSPPPLPPPLYPRLLYSSAAIDSLALPTPPGVGEMSEYTATFGPENRLILPLVAEIPRENLIIVEKLGQGPTTEVSICELASAGSSGITADITDHCISDSVLVAVKSLNSEADQKTRADFYREARTLSRLRDENVVQLIGVCTQWAGGTDSFSIVTEYMRYGDLKCYLQHHNAVWLNAITSGVHVRSLSYGALIYMATQIASGMKYLESMNLIHRDLAARNCLVGEMYQVKIADFGMSRSLYSNDYYRLEGHAVLPLRWMAWESVLLGRFSTKSDVWSFGVTLWEVLMLCRSQPFNELDDRMVIDNCRRHFDADGSHVVLPRPLVCPTETYDLMCQCWATEQSQRPSFREIHMFLQRKNLGYSPQQDMIISHDLVNNNDSILSEVAGDASSLLMAELSFDSCHDNSLHEVPNADQ